MQSFRSGVGDKSLGADVGVTFMKKGMMPKWAAASAYRGSRSE